MLLTFPVPKLKSSDFEALHKQAIPHPHQLLSLFHCALHSAVPLTVPWVTVAVGAFISVLLESWFPPIY